MLSFTVCSISSKIATGNIIMSGQEGWCIGDRCIEDAPLLLTITFFLPLHSHPHCSLFSCGVCGGVNSMSYSVLNTLQSSVLNMLNSSKPTFIATICKKTRTEHLCVDTDINIKKSI